MAKRRSRAERAAREAAKKNPKAFFTVVVIVLVLAIVAAACWYFLVYRKQDHTAPGGDGTQVVGGEVTEISSADLSIHFWNWGLQTRGTVRSSKWETPKC